VKSSTSILDNEGKTELEAWTKREEEMYAAGA
jgi:hypothetical protein